MSIEFALAAGVILAVLSPVIDGLIGGVLAPVLAFVVGVGSLAIGAIGDIVGNALAQDKLAGLTLPAQCGPPDGNGCRECHQEVDFFIPFVTHLFLRDAKVVDDGVLIIGAAAPDPAARPLPVIGTMSEVVLGKWFYPTVICQGADGNPRRTVSFTNTGQLPLYVCEVAQRITDPTTQPAILGIDRSIHEPGPAAIPVGAGDKAMVPPGATYVASVVAKVIGAAGYDQQNPPPLLLRILSSGGDQVIDLNGPGDAARPISPAEADFAERISEILCHALSWEEFEHLEWHAIAYTDPVPFRQSDRIIERLDVASQAPPAGTIVRALNSAQELLALSYGAGGAMQLSVEATRPPATAHRLTRIAFDVSPAIGAKQDRAGLGEAAAPKGARRSLRRLLYREAALFDVGPPILAAARAGSHLAVLTGDEVLIAAVGAVHLTRWTRRPVRAEALTSDGRHLLLAGARGILALDNQLRVVWRTETPGRALAHHGRSLWSADAEAITEWQHEADGWSARQRISLSDVTQLLATRQGAFALSGGWIWHLTEGQARPIGLRSAGLLTVAGAPSALSGDGAFVFDAHGRVRANYLQVPRAAAALHFPGVAVEVRPARGALVLHDVWETALDLNAAENQRPGVL